MRRRDLKLLVGGEWLSTADTLPVFNPNDGSEVARVPVVTRDHLLAAVEAAAKGFEIWRRTSPVDRARIMMRAAQILRANRDDIAHVITLELGKPLAQSLAEVDRSCDIIEWDAGEGQRLYGRVTQNDRNLRQIVVREPVGIVAG